MLASRILVRDGQSVDQAVTLALDQFAPAFRQSFRPRRDPFSVEIEPAVCSRSDAGIGAVAPVEKIVPRFGTRARVIGNLVSRPAGGFCNLLRDFEKFHGQVLIGNLQRAVSAEAPTPDGDHA